MSAAVKDIGKIFIKPSVQSLLKKITGYNPEKIFRETFNVKLKPPKLELLCQEDLEEVSSGCRLFESNVMRIMCFETD